MNSKNSKTSHPCRLLFNLTEKINLKRNDKHVALSNLKGKYNKFISEQKTENIRTNMECRIWVNWWTMFYIRYSILFWIYLKKEQGENVINNNHNPSIRRYGNT